MKIFSEDFSFPMEGTLVKFQVDFLESRVQEAISSFSVASKGIVTLRTGPCVLFDTKEKRESLLWIWSYRALDLDKGIR